APRVASRPRHQGQEQAPGQGRGSREADPRPGHRSGGRGTARRPARSKPSE
ncbi:pseudouridine synthase, partial [Aeromonas hydrophila]